MKYRTILMDPPWAMATAGQYKSRHERRRELPYPTMSLQEIEALPIGDLAEVGAHLWLWTTNQFLEQALALVPHWGFKRLNMITWAKPSGFGNYWIQNTEFLIFAYKQKCQFHQGRYIPNFYEWDYEETPGGIEIANRQALPSDLAFKWSRAKAGQHSKKPEGSYRLIESVSDPARVELFARDHQPLLGARPGWDVWGNQVESTITL